MIKKNHRNIQCKCSAGISCRWSIGVKKDGKFGAVSVRSAKRGFPTDFLPFEIMHAVLGHGQPTFDTLDEAEAYVRSL